MISYHRKIKRLQKISSEEFSSSDWYLWSELLFTLKNRMQCLKDSFRFNLWIITFQNITKLKKIIEHTIKTAPSIRMNEPHYPSYTAARVSKQNWCQHCAVCYKMGQCYETWHKCEDCKLALCATSSFQYHHTVVNY